MLLPVIDYDAHPAYRRLVGGLGEARAAAVRSAHADARRLVAGRLGDHLVRPAVSPDATGIARTFAENGIVPLIGPGFEPSHVQLSRCPGRAGQAGGRFGG